MRGDRVAAWDVTGATDDCPSSRPAWRNHDFRSIGGGLVRCAQCTETCWSRHGDDPPPRRRASRSPAPAPVPRRRRLPFRWRVVRALAVLLALVWMVAWLVEPDALSADAMVWGGVTIASWLQHLGASL
jgi:ferric-dicitrate binding protein FerR (iron transport regulator)